MFWHDLRGCAYFTDKNRLVGLVVRRPPWERKILGSNPTCARIFSGLSHTSDSKIGTPVATLPGAWHYSVSAGTGRPSVSILWLGEVESWICNFYLSVAARKWWLRTVGRPPAVTRPEEDQSLSTLPNMAMQTDIWWYGAHPMEHQVVTMPGPQPQTAHLLRLVRWIRKRREGNEQNACLVIRRHHLFSLSSHSGMLGDFERRTHSYRRSWKWRMWMSSTFRKPTWQMLITSPLKGTSSSSMTEQIDTRDWVTLIWNTIPAEEVRRSEGDSEYLAIRVIVQGREITVINCYCPPDKTLQILLFHWSITTYSLPATSMATLQAGDMLISMAEESK